MTDCEGCTNPAGGIFIRGCRQCVLRDLAAGPLFFGAMRAGKLTPEYRAALLAIGPDAAATHQEVKAAAKTHYTGAVG